MNKLSDNSRAKIQSSAIIAIRLIQIQPVEIGHVFYAKWFYKLVQNY